MSYDGFLKFSTKLDTSDFKKGVQDTEKDAKKLAATLAAEYRKAGMNQSEAMKKAWEDIKNSTNSGTETVKKSVQDTVKPSKDAASKISTAFKDCFKSIAAGSKTTLTALKTVGEYAVKSIPIIATGATAAAAVIGKISTSAISAYGDYEQLVGGVETLFGAGGQSIEEYAQSVGKSVAEVKNDYDILMSAQDAVLKNADNAYKTAGMSANEYMETVTSFSASLLQSLGGDTQAAAQKADMAVTDMSDNANKMGTDIARIQDAYQGFAKQNYTMLDNLKLGYGGTKTEMERLLADASKISGIRYDVSSFGDIADAIHIIQTQMGITGTTAKEAATTIQGSINMLKGAWENALTGMSDPEQDFDQLLQNLFDSITTVGENLIPRVKVVLNGVADMIGTLAPQLIAVIPGIISDLLPSITNGISQILNAVSTSLGSLVPILLNLIGTLAPVAVNIVTQLAQVVLQNLPLFIEVAAKLMKELALGIAQAAPTMIPQITKAVLEIAEMFVENIDVMIETAGELVAGLANGIVMAIPVIVEAAPKLIVAFAKGLIKSIPKVFEAVGKAISSLFTFDKAQSDKLDEAFKANTEAINSTKKAYEDYKTSQAEATQESMSSITHVSALASELDTLANANGEVSEANRLRAEFILGELNNALGTEYQMTEGVISNYSAIKDKIYELIEAKKLEILMSQAEEDYSNAIKNKAEAEKEYAQAKIDVLNNDNEATRNAYSIALENLSKYTNDMITYEQAYTLASQNNTAAAIEYLQQRNAAYSSATSASDEYTNSNISKLAQLEEAYKSSLSLLLFYLDEYEATGNETVHSLINEAISAVVSARDAFTAEGGNVVNGFISSVNSSDVNFSELKSNVASELSGISNEATQFLITQANGSAQIWEKTQSAIVANSEKAKKEAEKTGKDVNESVKKTVSEQEGKTIGENYSKGIASGILMGKSQAVNAAALLAKEAVDAPKKILVIRSPSRVMRDEVGKYISLGVAAGITENADSVTKAFKTMLDKLDYQKKFGIVSDSEYYAQLEQLRDKYLEAGTKDWLEYTNKIYEYQKQRLENEKKTIQSLYKDIADYATKQLDEVTKKQESMAKKLKSYSRLYDTVTVVFDGEETTSYKLHDISKDTDVLSKYNEMLAKTKEKINNLGLGSGIASEFLTSVENMGIDEATKYLTALFDAPEKDFAKYISEYKKYIEEQNTASHNYYTDDFKKAWDNSITYMRDKLAEAGYEIPEGFALSGSISAEKFGNEFVAELEKQINDIKTAYNDFKINLTPEIPEQPPEDKPTEDIFKKTYDMLNNAGYEVPKTFFNSVNKSMKTYGQMLFDELKSYFTDISNQIDSFNSSIMSKLHRNMVLQGNGNTYNTTTNSYTVTASNGEDTVSALKRHETLKRLAGI